MGDPHGDPYDLFGEDPPYVPPQRNDAWKQATGGMTAFMENAPRWLVHAFGAASKWVGIQWETGSDVPFAKDERRPYSDLRGAEAIGSMFDPGKPAEETRTSNGEPYTIQAYESSHIFMIDLDHAAVLLDSSTPGHHHLVVNVELDWSAYKEILDVLAKHDIVENGYVDASKERGETFLRLPWIRKHQEQHDARAAIAEWLDEAPPDQRPFELQDVDRVQEWLDGTSDILTGIQPAKDLPW